MKARIRRARWALPASVLSVGAALTSFAAHATPPATILVPGERIFPESLTSSADGAVIVGSILQHAIFRAAPGAARAQLWIRPGAGGLQNVFGVFADDRSATLWACSNNFVPGGAGAPSSPGALHAFDLRTGAPKGRYVFPTAGALCNDIAVGPDGTVYATDTTNMQVMRLKPGAARLEVWAGHGAFGPVGGLVDGIAVLGQRVLVGTLASSKLFSVPIQSDGTSGPVAEVRLDQPLARPDGIRSFGRNSLLVAEGGGTGRLSRVILIGNRGTLRVLEAGFADGPVSVTVVGTKAYLLEGQLALLFPRSRWRTWLLPEPTPNPFHATAVEVGLPGP